MWLGMLDGREMDVGMLNGDWHFPFDYPAF